MTKDIYQEITNHIIEALEKVEVADYKAPFAMLASHGLPTNVITGNGYRGVNTLVLWLQQQKHQYVSHEWGTFMQWKEKGAQVRKGEKSTPIIFYRQVEKKEQEEEGDEPEFYPMVKSYNVFNAGQVDGCQSSVVQEERTFSTVERIEHIECFIAASGAVIEEGKAGACYCPLTDIITMPGKALFLDNGQTATENYYATLLHELTHWTGGSKRLAREQSSYHADRQCYAFEELIAELGSAFICSKFGINQHGRDDHAIYIKSWLSALKQDKKYIFKAASQAQKAVDWLSGRAGT